MLQELEERIQNLLPVGPSWKATQNLTLWAKERETALEEATNYAGLGGSHQLRLAGFWTSTNPLRGLQEVRPGSGDRGRGQASEWRWGR